MKVGGEVGANNKRASKKSQSKVSTTAVRIYLYNAIRICSRLFLGSKGENANAASKTDY